MNLRNFLLQYLKTLPQPQFEEIVFWLEGEHPESWSNFSSPHSPPNIRAMELIRFLEQDNQGLASLCDRLGFTTPGASLVQLEPLVRQAALPEDKIRRTFQTYLHTLGEQATLGAQELRPQLLWQDLLRILLDPSWMKSTGQSHLLHFINLLAADITPRRAWQNWLRKTAQSLGIAMPQRPDTPSDQISNYLLLALSKKGGYYTLHAWFIGEPGFSERIAEKKLPRGLDDMPQRLPEVLAHDKVIDAVRGGKTPVIEFFLPVDLLNLDLDQWGRRGDKPLSTSYALVVRCLERFEDRRWCPDWGEYWNKHCAALDNALCQHCITWLNLRSARGPRCGTHLRSGRWLFGAQNTPDQTCFEQMLSAGIAILLWPRRPVRRAQWTAVKEAIAQQVIEALPECLRRWRDTRWDTHQDTGYFSLLWDDPQRWPEKDQPQGYHPDHM